MTPEQKQAFIAKHSKTDLTHRLSYDSGVENFVGVKDTTTTMKVMLENRTETAQNVYFAPKMSNDSFAALLVFKGLSAGSNLVNLPAEQNEDENLLIAVCKDSDQNFAHIFSSVVHSPFHIKGLSMRSYSLAKGNGESTNYTNEFKQYFVPIFKRPTFRKLDFADFQSSEDNNTEILKVDFIKANFPSIVSLNDMPMIVINAGTRMDITFEIGARYSPAELFSREVNAGIKMLREEFPASCGCK